MLEKLVSFIVFSFIAITTERSAGGDGGRATARLPRPVPAVGPMALGGWMDR